MYFISGYFSKSIWKLRYVTKMNSTIKIFFGIEFDNQVTFSKMNLNIIKFHGFEYDDQDIFTRKIHFSANIWEMVWNIWDNLLAGIVLRVLSKQVFFANISKRCLITRYYPQSVTPFYLKIKCKIIIDIWKCLSQRRAKAAWFVKCSWTLDVCW